jgi:RAB protein geranylgeranyltransferase component A
MLNKNSNVNNNEEDLDKVYKDYYLRGTTLTNINSEANFKQSTYSNNGCKIIIIEESNDNDNIKKNLFNLNFEGLSNFMKSENFREYNFDLNPKFLYSQSKSTTELSQSNASKYLEFLSVKKIYLVENEKFLSTPCSKSEIFISEDLNLLEKQKLLNFILSVMKLKNENTDVNSTVDIKKNYEIENNLFEEMKNSLNYSHKIFLKRFYSEKIQKLIKIILANINPNDENNYSLDYIIERIYKYLISLQVYDDSPLIYSIYGSSEFSQALSRVACVFGTIFIVNENLTFEIKKNIDHFLDKNEKRFVIHVQDFSN